MAMYRALWVDPSDKPGEPSAALRHAAFAEGPVSDPGPVVAEGDSWFDYPPHRDVLDHLVGLFGWRIRRLSDAGDTLENMVLGTRFGPGFRRRPAPLDLTLAEMKRLRSRFLLFSGGGNDVAGDEFASFLNHADSGLPILRERALDDAMAYFRRLFEGLLRRVGDEVGDAHVFAHGYAYPVPDGRGVVRVPVLGWTFWGPWLRPALTAKNVPRDHHRGLVRELIDRFNAMLGEVERGSGGRFHAVDLRDLVSDADWANELHLKPAAYGRVAVRLARRVADVMARRPD
ncbi:MAG: hypothetical protein FJ255_08540 [Phycisphaerae bacterium]|nr:hypothetical protein [Phycisphaerae bacterium]